MVDKSLVRRRFSNAASSYREEARVQNAMGHILSDAIVRAAAGLGGINHFGRVLEFGAGSGNYTEIFSAKITFDELNTNDISDAFTRCESSSLATNFILGDIEEVIDGVDGRFDLITSNATMQWITAPEMLLRKLHGKLFPGGLLAISTFGPMNLREITAQHGDILNYYDTEKWHDLLKGLSFRVVEVQDSIEELFFDSALDVMRHLKATGVNANRASGRWTKGRLEEWSREYAANNSADYGKVKLTYHPLYFLAERL